MNSKQSFVFPPVDTVMTAVVVAVVAVLGGVVIVAPGVPSVLI